MRSRSLTGLFVLAIVALLAIPSFSIYYTDWLWFLEVGYGRVFLRSFNTQGAVFLGVFLTSLVFLYGNIRIAQLGMAVPRLVFGRTEDGRPVAIEGGGITRLALTPGRLERRT